MHRVANLAAAAFVMLTLAAESLHAQAKPLKQDASIEKPIARAPLRDVLEYLGEKYEVRVRIDDAAFKKIGINNVGTRSVYMPKMIDVPLEFILECAVQQVGGTLRQNGEKFEIVPGQRDLASLLGPPTSQLKKKLAKEMEIKEPIRDVAWSDVIEYFSEKQDVNFVVAEWQFPPVKAIKKAGPINRLPIQDVPTCFRPDSRFHNVPCSLPAESRPLEKWLDQLANQIGGEIHARSNVILIVPRRDPREDG